MKLSPALILVLLFSLCAAARAADFGPMSKIALTPLTDASSLPAGATGTIALQIQIAPGWHIQTAQNAPDTISTAVEMSPTPNVTLGKILYPQDTPILVDMIPADVYEDSLTILIPFTISPSATPGILQLHGELTTQACSTACLAPAKTPFDITLNITPAGTPAVPQNQAFFEAARKQKWLTIVPRPVAPVTQVSRPPDASGIPLMTNQQQIDAITQRPYRAANEKHYSISFIILFALIGGAILNVMPCVLPVIPLKVLGLVQQAHGDRRLAIIHALTFSAGIISLFVALAVVLKIMGLFYGQQFQSPAFLIAMAFLVLALALSMLGVWTIQTPQAVYKMDKPHSAYLGSFSSGLLATLLATPCSAPYLGPVLGWALLQPAPITALALGFVGVGMSLPYLILAAFPGLLKTMPKAGRWTELLKQALGIVMIGVSIYLITLLPNSTMWPFVLFGAVVLGLVCWGWGQIPTGAMEAATVWGIRITVLILGLAAGAGIYAWGAATVQYSNAAAAEDGWTPFNVALLDEALKSGRPVVVDWTANWCINCRVLEARVLRTPQVQAAFARQNVLLLKADQTIDNPPTALLNKELGGQSIPVLAIFSPAHPYTPVVLRDNYPAAKVIDELQKAKAP